MRKVANKEAVRRLSDRGFQTNKLRNSIAAIAIALTAMRVYRPFHHRDWRS